MQNCGLEPRLIHPIHMKSTQHLYFWAMGGYECTRKEHGSFTYKDRESNPEPSCHDALQSCLQEKCFKKIASGKQMLYSF